MIGIENSGLFSLFVLAIVIWTIPWKGLALWRAAKRDDKWWFIVFLVVNLLAIPEIVYLIMTREKKIPSQETEPSPPMPI